MAFRYGQRHQQQDDAECQGNEKIHCQRPPTEVRTRSDSRGEIVTTRTTVSPNLRMSPHRTGTGVRAGSRIHAPLLRRHVPDELTSSN